MMESRGIPPLPVSSPPLLPPLLKSELETLFEIQKNEDTYIGLCHLSECGSHNQYDCYITASQEVPRYKSAMPLWSVFMNSK